MMKGAGGWRCRHQKVWRKEERRRSERKYSHQNIKIPINALLSEHSTSTHNHTINFEYFQRSQAILSHTITAKPLSTCHDHRSQTAIHLPPPPQPNRNPPAPTIAAKPLSPCHLRNHPATPSNHNQLSPDSSSTL